MFLFKFRIYLLFIFFVTTLSGPLYSSKIVNCLRDYHNSLILLKGRIINERQILGIADSYVVELENGVKAIFKPAQFDDWTSNYKAEVLAYYIDNLFGFNLVPLTVERTVNGTIGSLQLFKKGKFIDILGTPPRVPNSKEADKLSFFDYLIDSGDRHNKNYLITKKGKIVAIDNSLSFTGKGHHHITFKNREEEIKRFFKSKNGKVIFKELKNINQKILKKDLKKYLSGQDAKKFIDRLNSLILYYKHNIK